MSAGKLREPLTPAQRRELVELLLRERFGTGEAAGSWWRTDHGPADDAARSWQGRA